MADKVKSGKEILDDFFSSISDIKKVNKKLASSLAELHQQGKLTDTNIKNTLQKLRESNADKD